MELRELRYFLAVAREESISKAAEFLYMTQPSLSRQMQNLENEIGKKLFIRGSRKITLTEAGVLLRKRADELIALYDKTEAEILAPEEDMSGSVIIGGGESAAVSLLAKASKAMLEENPNVSFKFFSGDYQDIKEKLDKGLLDFGIIIEPADLSAYEFLRFPVKDIWGVLMRKDSPLAEKDVIRPEDLWSVPVIRSNQTLEHNELYSWFGRDPSLMNTVGTYNLIYNATLLVKEGVGYAVTLDGLADISDGSPLTFRPLYPKIEAPLALVWKRYQTFSRPAEVFLEFVKKEFGITE